MASILATATRSAAHWYKQEVVREHARAWLNGAGSRRESGLTAFDTGLVEQRSSAIPLEEVFSSDRRFGASNDRYAEVAVELSTAVASAALEQAGLAPEDVDFFVTSSCTGFMIPSVDAHVAERLRMKPTLRRLPITEHGCAGGAVALGCARDHLAANASEGKGGERRFALVVAVELPSLTFQVSDRSAANVVSAALFGDGAAAVVLSSDPNPGRPRIVRTGSRRFEKSLDWMGFHLQDSGLRVVLSREIPRQVEAHGRTVIESFLRESGLEIGDVRHFLFHPGGRKILEAFERTVALPKDALAASRKVLRDHGNLSSATVLYILDEHLRRGVARAGERGLLIAFGPGFGAELLLLQWD
jgi:predicted naringenin-chalcone synthase